jgi:hypothetical protein
MSFTPEDLFPGQPDKVRLAQELLEVVRQRLDEATLNYRFMWQMLGNETELPTADAMTLIVADAYMRAMRAWDGVDPLLPLTFAALTVREVTRNDA